MNLYGLIILTSDALVNSFLKFYPGNTSHIDIGDELLHNMNCKEVDDNANRKTTLYCDS